MSPSSSSVAGSSPCCCSSRSTASSTRCSPRSWPCSGLANRRLHQDWVPLESISPNLIHAVMVSEDSRFCEHWGIDFVEIGARHRPLLRRLPARRQHYHHAGRQEPVPVAGEELLRKVIEVPLTFAIELFWPKRRILEVYLNIAEWGPGHLRGGGCRPGHFGRPAVLAPAPSGPAGRGAAKSDCPRCRFPGPADRHQASVIQRAGGPRAASARPASMGGVKASQASGTPRGM